MLPVTLLTGVDEEFRAAVAANTLAAAGPAGVLVEYDVSGLAEGSVVRIARTAGGVIDREVIRMSHPCVSCAMRDSLVQLLLGIAAVERYGVAIVSMPAPGTPRRWPRRSRATAETNCASMRSSRRSTRGSCDRRPDR